MKVREDPVHAVCEFCKQDDPNCYPVEFSRSEEILILCDPCIGIVRIILGLVGVKESEA